MNYIEQVLRNKANEDGCSILVSKWNYDSTLIPEALETIPLIFPHFSKHNKSHSETILNNIVNILGKEMIAQLSSTDLWLILESAYSHDLGMVITADMIKSALDTGSFLNYFQRVSADSNHEMYKYASYYELKDNKLILKDMEFSLKIYDSVRFLMSDYFRSLHAENSLRAITDSESVLSLDLPKAIVPSRLINMMGAVCRSHTLTFNEVMSLPQVENGIATDMAHPRFVACLLRLGDILDIDNNRFSGVFLKTITEMPELSQLHKDKHLSIVHLRIDNRYIEIKAKCKSPRVAKVTKEWFSWIKDEVNNQTLLWNAIVPNDISCYLPTISQLEIEIDGYDSQSTIELPQFTIDVNKALELLQGKNFYKDPFDSIREILQNAVDATLLKFYMMNRDADIIKSGITEAFLNAAQEYPIRVKVYRDIENKIHVSVVDKGVGISKKQLKFLSNTGSSSKNFEKQKVINEMPGWLRPSGAFGIGFQSVFLLTDKVEIQTKDFFTDETMGIEMYNPRSKMKGDIYIKPCRHMYESGFSIHFILNEEWNIQKPSKYKFNCVDKQSDSLSDICKKVKQYGKMSFFPIICNEENIEREQMQFFDEETGIELKFSNTNDFKKQEFYFKNASIKALSHVPFFSLEANFHSCNSSDYLTIDRSSFKDNMEDKAHELLSRAVMNYISSSCFAPIYYYDMNSFVLYSRVHGAKKPIQCLAKDWNFVFKGLQLSEYLKFEKIIVTTTFNKVNEIEVKEENGQLHIFINILAMAMTEDLINCVLKILSDNYKNCYLKRMFVENRFSCTEFVFQNEDECDEDIVDLLPTVIELVKNTGQRAILPYVNGFSHLRIPADVANDLSISLGASSKIPANKVVRIISPFVKDGKNIQDDRSEELYAFVQSCNGSSIEDIKADYDNFVLMVKSMLDAIEKN